MKKIKYLLPILISLNITACRAPVPLNYSNNKSSNSSSSSSLISYSRPTEGANYTAEIVFNMSYGVDYSKVLALEEFPEYIFTINDTNNFSLMNLGNGEGTTDGVYLMDANFDGYRDFIISRTQGSGKNETHSIEVYDLKNKTTLLNLNEKNRFDYRVVWNGQTTQLYIVRDTCIARSEYAMTLEAGDISYRKSDNKVYIEWDNTYGVADLELSLAENGSGEEQLSLRNGKYEAILRNGQDYKLKVTIVGKYSSLSRSLPKDTDFISMLRSNASFSEREISLDTISGKTFTYTLSNLSGLNPDTWDFDIIFSSVSKPMHLYFN